MVNPRGSISQAEREDFAGKVEAALKIVAGKFVDEKGNVLEVRRAKGDTRNNPLWGDKRWHQVRFELVVPRKGLGRVWGAKKIANIRAEYRLGTIFVHRPRNSRIVFADSIRDSMYRLKPAQDVAASLQSGFAKHQSQFHIRPANG